MFFFFFFFFFFIFSSGQNVTNFRVGFLPFKTPWVIERFTPLYFFMYFQQLVSILLTANISVAPDTLFTSLFYYLCGHFDILNSRLRGEKDPTDKDGEKKDFKTEHEIYKKSISQHHELIR